MILQIAGIVALDDNEASEVQLESMLAAMNPRRRPAEYSMARDGPALFAAISIAPGGERPKPPCIVADDQGLFVADVVLWEQPDATADRDDANPVLRTARLIRRGGPEACAGLHGDFAWALWQGDALWLGRDHFGARPIYYTVRPGRWAAFASYPGALIDADLARPALDFGSVLNLTVRNSPLKGRSYQVDIATQPPAHHTVITRQGRIEGRRYWRLPMGPRLSERTDPREISGEVRRLLEQAVKRRLPSSGTVGGHLSGGIDSSPLSVIAARAIRGQGRRLIGYSLEESATGLGFEPVDEAPYVAEIVAAEPNIDHFPVPDPSFEAPLLGPYDTALLEPAYEAEHKILEHAETAGIETIYSGWGGDQIVSYNTELLLSELLLHGHWGKLAAALRQFRTRSDLVFFHHVLMPLLTETWQRRVMRMLGRKAAKPETRPTFRPSGLPEKDPPEHWLPPPGLSFLRRREMVERNFIQHRLARFAHLGAPFGVRYVYPLLDLDLVRFAMRVPMHFLVRKDASRCLLRDAIRGLVPESVRLREAKLFPNSLDTLRLPSLRHEIDARLAAISPDGVAAKAVDIQALRAAYRETLASTEETLEQMRAHAVKGEQLFLEAFKYSSALQLAVALDEYDRKHGRHVLD